ncbi:hypothetical protein [Vibrio sp. 10N.239.312.D08]|uniref:hypothetical protein n=1 Tax=Vibrio sp. 10N.239.312.D08 TaxID=3229978 RepID=UPI003550A6D1
MNKVNLYNQAKLPTEVQPLPGDVVIPLSGQQVGKQGLIERIYGDKSSQVGFNVSAYKVKGARSGVQCSGGPFISPNIHELELIGTTNRKFWYNPNGSGYGQGEEYLEEVNVWAFMPKYNELSNSLNHEFVSYSDYLVHYEAIKKARNTLAEQAKIITDQIRSKDFYEVSRGDRQIKSKTFEFGNGFSSDYLGEKLITCYQKNECFQVFQHDEPVGCGYLYTTSHGIAFKNKEELNATIKAYGLKVSEKEGSWNSLLLVPNIDCENWLPLNIKFIQAAAAI